MESNGLITNFQCGFRSKRSTVDHLVRLETFVREAFIKKEHLTAVFFDLEKAYDTTWKYGIVRDLSDFGLKGRLPIFIDNFLSNRNFKVRVGTTLSGLQGQEEGVPQGSILSVTLFSIKINNIVKALNPGVDCSLYVDDFLICYRSKHIHTIERQLQQCLNKIQKWALENGFKFSKTKTQSMHFCQLRGLHNDPVLNCAPLLADIFLYSYEAEFIQTLIKSGKRHLAKSFNFTYRYIDDVFSLNNHKFSDYVYDIYPVELEIKETTDDQYHSSFLDLLLEIDKDGRLRVKIYDKRDDFNFDIVNFPFLCGNVPQSPSYGVYISQLIRYARASTLYDDFLSRSCRLTSKLMRQGYERFKLISAFKKFYGRHKILVDRYKVSVTHIISDLFLETLYRS